MINKAYTAYLGYCVIQLNMIIHSMLINLHMELLGEVGIFKYGNSRFDLHVFLKIE